MRLVLKLTLATTLVLTGVLAAHAYLRVQRELAMLEGDMQRDHLTLARAVAWSLQAVAERDGKDQALELLTRINDQDQQFQLSWQAGNHPALGGPTHRISTADDGTRALVTSIPVAMADSMLGRLEVRESLAASGQYVSTTVKRVILLGVQTVLACTLIIAVFGWLLVGRPLRLVTEGARRVGEGDLSARVALRQNDEIGTLARAFDLMCEQLAEAGERARAETQARLAALEQLRHAERLSTVGKLASGIAHELGTPLNVVIARARMIERGESVGAEAVEDAAIVAQQAERITRVIRQLLDFARRSKPRKEPTDLRQLAETVISLLKPMATKQQVELLVEQRGELPQVPVDPTQIQQVLTNLVVNAIQAQGQGGTVRILLEPTVATLDGDDGAERSWARLTVWDRGPGIVGDAVQQVFEPFFTTKKAGVGTGLGLSVAQGIVQEHGGQIGLRSSEKEGTEFAVLLPLEGNDPPGATT